MNPSIPPKGRRDAQNFTQNNGIPHAFDAETAILASFFVDKLSIAIARERYNIAPSDFFFEAHRLTAQAIFEEFDKGRAVDVFTIAGNLARHNQLETVGGRGKLEEIAGAGAEFTHVETYAQDIKNAAAKRWAFHRAGEISRMAQNGVSPSDITAFLEQTAQELAQQTADLGTASRQRFTLIPAPEFKNRPRPEFLVEGMVVNNSLASLEGEPGSYKSFIAIAFAACVATGRPWCGRNVKQGGVVYISGEGSSGLGARQRAWEIVNGVDLPADFLMLPESVQMMTALDVEALIQAIQMSGITPRLVVVDTLARCMVGGDENSAQDMGLFIAGADRIKNALGCTVLVVHHQGKNGKVRGSSALPGAMDTRMECNRAGDRLTLSCDKQKDYDEFEKIGLIRRIVDIDEEGGTSLVFDTTADTVEEVETNQRMESCLQVLAESERALRFAEWKEACKFLGIPSATFTRIRKKLLDQGRIVQSGSMYIAPDLEK